VSGAGGLLELEYRHAAGGERHALRLHLAPFAITAATTGYGLHDHLYVAGGPVMPLETSVLQTFAALAALWAPYYSPNWSIAVVSLQRSAAGTRSVVLPRPLADAVVGSASGDDDSGPRTKRIFHLLGRTGAARRFYLSQVRTLAQPEQPVEVSPSSGGLDARDRAWMAYLSGASGGGAVMADGTYSFPVRDLEVQWARPIELVGAEGGMPGAPYLVGG
jgi:hypothetical protein